MIVNESPDSLNYNNRDVSFHHPDAVAFGYYKNVLYVGRNKYVFHGNLVPYYVHKRNIFREQLKYAGRFWFESKIISFWEYPKSNSEMRKIVNQISEKFNAMKRGITIDIWNDYKIEIVVDKNGDILYDRGTDTISKFIPVKEYINSMDMEKHVLQNPLKNPYTKKSVAPGSGSKKRYKISPEYQSKIGSGYSTNDVPAFLNHQLKYSSEGYIKLKTIVEDTIGSISQKINVKFDINKTGHASLRQNRDIEHPISNQEILNIVNLTLSKMTNMLLFDEMNMGDYVLIKHDDINVVGVLSPGNNNEIDFIVVTVMRKHDFKPKSGTKVIEI